MNLPSEINSFYETAIFAATEAGKILKEGFETPFHIDFKEGKNNLVTEYDKKSEDFIINYIKSRHPSHGFIAEESGKSHASAEYLWIIDPLDGTSNYAHSVPVFSVSIALYHKSSPLIGVVNHPLANELFTAIKGKGAFLNGRALKVTEATDLSESFIATGFPYNLHENPDNCIETLLHLLKLGSPIRRLGSAAIDLAYVAAGRFDAFYEVKLQPWDYAAGRLLVEEAGGVVTSYKGDLLCHLKASSCIASNPSMHKILMHEVNHNKR